MNTHCLRYALAAILLGVGLARAQDVPPDAAAALAQAMAAAMGQASGDGAAPAAINAGELKALLPGKDAFEGFKRVKAGTESNTAMGFKVVVAKAEFEALKGEAEITIKYTDIGSLGALAKMVQAQEIDEETENGFRRTTTYDGFKTLEEYDGEDKEARIMIYLGDQVTVEVETEDMEFEAARKVVGKLDLKKLAALKPKPAPAPAK